MARDDAEARSLAETEARLADLEARAVAALQGGRLANRIEDARAERLLMDVGKE